MAKETTDEGTIKEMMKTLYVGRKPVMSYLLAVVTHFNTSGSEEIVIKARGQSVNIVVDTAEIIRNRFATDAEV